MSNSKEEKRFRNIHTLFRNLVAEEGLKGPSQPFLH